jgi:uncharacterized protein DUF6263
VSRTYTRIICVLALAALAAPLYAQNVTLRYHWNKGETLSYRMVILTNSQVTGMPGRGDARVQQTMTQTLKIAVDDVAPDGTATLKQTFDSVRMEMDGPMGKFVYDTASPAPATSNPMAQSMGKVLGAMVGETILVIQAPDGTVRRVEGATRIMDKIVKSLGADPSAAAIGQALKTSLSDDALKATLEQSFTKLPAAPVKPGDTWKGEMTMGNEMIGKITGAVDFTLKALDGAGDAAAARIGVAITMKQDSTPPPGPGGMVVKLQDARGDGEMFFDVGKGRIRKSTMKSTMPSTITGQSPDGNAVSMQNNTTTTMTFELIDK